MQTVQEFQKNNTFSDMCSDIGHNIQDDWAGTGLTTALYAVPLIGGIFKVLDWCDRCQGGFGGVFPNRMDLDQKDQKITFLKKVHETTRTRQTSDLLYVIASLVSLVVFSGIGISSVGLLFTAAAPTMFWASVMILHAQDAYNKILKKL